MYRAILGLVVLLLTGACGDAAVGSFSDSTSVTTTSPSQTAPPSTAVPDETVTTAKQAEECDGRIVFDSPPVDLDAIEYIVPLGLMFDSHVTPVDHQYFQNFEEPDRWIDVYSPGPGRVTGIQHMDRPITEDGTGVVDDYRIVIEHTCTISSIFIHIGELAPKLEAVAPEPGGHVSVDVSVEGGELLGVFQGNVDYNVVDLDYTTEGLIVPQHYEAEPWKIHTPDPFLYFTEELRRSMEKLSLRNGGPPGGRFAYDIDGRLVGNWFQEGTNGYAGLGPPRYWSTHISIAYNHIDPRLVVVSLGDFEGRSRQFAVAGNSPNPAEVTVESGLVVYELVDFDYWVGDRRWDRVGHAAGIEARASDEVVGVVLFQLLDDRRLRMEAFSGVTADDVDGFSGAALVYER